ncbi:MAG: GlsB/YeaQ/YmgE family stress response membrane protein [Bacillota bacterium]|nr:GlsB/YeaQ/YmgE family stress response membrane protein [Bacillota bacterium]
MGILSWIIVGAIAGMLANLIMGSGGFGLIGSILLGILGALVGGWLFNSILGLPYNVTGINLISVLVATGGAVVVLFIVGLLRR